MSHPGPPSLQLLSLNVNGVRERQKRAALFAVNDWYVGGAWWSALAKLAAVLFSVPHAAAKVDSVALNRPRTEPAAL